MGKKHIPLAVVAATAIALSSGQSAFATETGSPKESNVTGTEGADNTILEKKTISKVEKISKTEIVVIYKEEVQADTVILAEDLAVTNASGTVKLEDYKIDETNKKKVTYTFAAGFAYGKWTVENLPYEVKRAKIDTYKGIEVVNITTSGVTLKLPKDVDIATEEELSVKNPKGEEIAVTTPALTSTDANRNVIYTFASPLESIAAGKWTINTDVQFTVLSDEENQKKADAVDKKIKTARTTLSTNKNYVKNILAAKTAYDALTSEQKVKVKDYTYLENLVKEITDGVYKDVAAFESKMDDIATASTDSEFVNKVQVATDAYNKLTKTQLSYLDAKVKKQYTAYLNEAIVKEAFSATSDVVKNADKIIAFNKAYKKLSKTEKEDILLDSAKKQKVTELTDKTLQKNASAALVVQKKFNKLEVQKKNDKNKKLYYDYVTGQDGNTTKTETTTKTAEPVMVPSLSAISKARTAYTTLQNKNPEAAKLVDVTTLEGLEDDDFVKDSIKRGKDFNLAVADVAQATNFVEAFNKAKAAYIALTADEKKYAIDKNALKQYKAYLKIDKVAVMYDKMDDPEASKKSMKLAYTAKGDITSITNDVKFSKGKFTIPKGNYEFAFKDGDEAKVAYYKDGKWTVADTLPELTKTIATAQEIYAYAKAFNALKDADEAILTKGPNGEVYKQYVGKENDYKKAAAVERKIVSAAKSKRKATIASAQKAYVALTEDQKNLVTNVTELNKLK
ncbi:hypothetical protein [Kurthia massiliensis]|uniref:hypothetical protein n=1 Tax=Kurthia massiliensis TaxID=1033739 RepID=UPI000288EBE2|nr:hypothetical protein [Kurthia massiliensis]